MAGVLSFALGLETSAFSGALDRAGNRLLAFLSIGKLVSETIEGVWGAIERGGALNDLSARTGESVATLYELQEAFKVVGISSDSVPFMINRFNKSLSGVGDMGEKTVGAFDALGLSMDDLKKMDAPAQLSAVAEKLALLDKGSGMDVASRLFGREGAANMMQLTRDVQSFRETLAESAREAAVFARNAAAFDKLGDTITRLKGSLSGMFAGIAEGVVPTLQGVADALNQIDLVAIGQNIGTMFTGAFQAFREGKLSMVIADSIVAGFEMAVAMLPGVFQKIGTMLLKMFETPLIYFQSVLEASIQGFMAAIGDIPGIGKATGLAGFQPQTFGDIVKDRKATGLEFFTEGNGLDQMNQSANEAMAAGMDKVKTEWAALFGEFADFASRAPETPSPWKPKDTNVPTTTTTGDSKPQKPDVTALEKMGFIFNGGSSVDPTKQTANNTKTLVDIGRQTLKAIVDQKNPKPLNA
jgi:hypothetical protein